MKDYILARMREPSTWRGFVLVLTALGVPLSPGAADTIVAVGLAIAGAIGVAAPDR